VTNNEGYYAIINVRPGTYSVRASFVGFTPVRAENVQVNIDQTTALDFEMQVEAVGMDEVIVTVQRPVVQRDVSASLANITPEQMENLPVASVADVISLQAGFEPGLEVRGSGGNQVAFAVDGISYTNPRSNNPNTEISFTSIDEVQVQTGGFSAEYGNVRSGLINVVTKEPSRDRYTADVILRYSPPSQKNFTEFGSGFGDVENGFNAYPRLSRDQYLDPTTGEMCEVSLCGVGILPAHLRTQYEQFGGWNGLADGSGYTPEQLRAAQEWIYRKDFEISEPDYEVDGTITGPVPGIGPMLGDLRFSASVRRAQEAFVIPGQRSAETRQTFQGKLVSNVGPGMKLVLSGIHNKTEAIAFTGEGMGYVNVSAGVPEYTWDDRNYIEGNLAGFSDAETFGDWLYSPHDITNTLYSMEFTHTLSAKTFYEVKLQRNGVKDLTGAPHARLRDANGEVAVVRCVTPSLQIREASSCGENEVPLTEAPFGYNSQYETTATGQNLGSQRGDARDSSQVARWSGRFDITSQVNRFMQVKGGVEFLYSDYDVFFGSWDPANPHQENERYRWDRSPIQGGLYGQTKLEFKGMVANLGLRADYFHAGGEWYDYTAFSTLFSASQGFNTLDQAETTPTERNLTLSPRLGVSFPVTDNSKFYFNYGHFRQMPDPFRLFEIQYGAFTTQITRIGNPSIILPKTVAYELGFEQNLLDLFLVRLAGFYRDISDEGRDVTYVSIDGLVNYARQEPLGWGDNRGFEVTLEKTRGDWLRGFVNYTYLSRKNGRFGYGTISENRREFIQMVESPTSLDQNSRVPEPYANVNLELHFPKDFGPAVAGANLLGDWRVNLLGEWRNGAPSSWDIGGNNFTLRGTGNDRRIAYNVKWKDFWMFDMRLSKNFSTSVGRAQFYVDIENVFNIRQLYWRGARIFNGDNDARDYFRSLHLPAAAELYEGLPEESLNPGYNWVPGDDQPGDYRKPGVPFQPIAAVTSLPDAPADNNVGAWHWAADTGNYSRWNGSAWEAVPSGEVDQVLDDKAYIDMPNNYVMGFLNPRNVYFGIRLTF
jgi:outer membrane receptor protein involved in Fe transport